MIQVMYSVFSLFPDLFALSLLGVMLLRIVAALYFLSLGYRAVTRNSEGEGDSANTLTKLSGIGMLAVGLLLLFGLYTQAAALAGSALLVILLEQGLSRAPTDPMRPLYVLLLTITLSLLVLGPGAFSIDLPL